MKLLIRRDQVEKKGVFGSYKGMSFSLFCKIQISPEEQQLIDKYKVNDHGLTWTDTDKGPVPVLTVKKLTKGHTSSFDDITVLLSEEETIKKACREFKNLLMSMVSFGGEETIEI